MPVLSPGRTMFVGISHAIAVMAKLCFGLSQH